MVLDSLLTFYCKKDNTKKKQVIFLLDNMKYDETTKVFSCPSIRYPENRMKDHEIKYIKADQTFWCDCEAKLYKKYNTYEDAIERYQKKPELNCVHIIAVKIYQTLKHNDIRN